MNETSVIQVEVYAEDADEAFGVIEGAPNRSPWHLGQQRHLQLPRSGRHCRLRPRHRKGGSQCGSTTSAARAALVVLGT